MLYKIAYKYYIFGTCLYNSIKQKYELLYYILK